MNKLEKELERLDVFLLLIDKRIKSMLYKENIDTQDISSLIDIRTDILERVGQIHSIQNRFETWKNYKHP